MSNEFDPLDYHTIADTVASALLNRPRSALPITESFTGAGVYVIYYHGEFEPYAPISGSDIPIYVGKAIPAGSRRGAALRQIESTKSPALWNRLRDHTTSIDDAENLELTGFACRYLVVTPIWITIAESLLISRFRPVWNSVVDGFGLHHPGRTRSHRALVYPKMQNADGAEYRRVQLFGFTSVLQCGRLPQYHRSTGKPKREPKRLPGQH